MQPFLTSKKYTLPCGNVLWLERPRSDGILTPDELAFCHHSNIPVAFDPMQSGWVPAQAHDDLAQNEIANPAHRRIAHLKPKTTLHLHLRAWASSDVERYTDLLDDPLIWDNMPEAYPDPLTPDIAAALIELSNTSNHHQVHAVLYDDLPVGQVRLLFDCDPKDPGVAEISYWFGRAYWGQGLASLAVSAFVRQSLAENPGLTSLIARVKDTNAASIRVLAKAGFVQNGADAVSGWTLMSRRRCRAIS